MNKCVYCGNLVKNKFCDVSCLNRYYNPKRTIKIKRNNKICNSCGRKISLSNYERHLKVCINDDKIHINEQWKVENKYKCPYCKKVYSKSGIGTHIWMIHTEKGKHYRENKNYSISFNWKNDELKLKNAVEKFKKTYDDRLKSGKIKPGFLNCKHTKETIEFLSERQSKFLEECGKSGFKHIKWYRIKNIKKEEFVLRGTYELRVAEYLNKNNIYWKRKIYIKYVDNEGIKRTYTPDFYIPKYDTYIETKGYYSEMDKQKMERVVKQNNIDIIMIFKKDLENLDTIINCGVVQ